MNYATPAPASGATPQEAAAFAGGTVDIGRTLDEGA